jgi:hypothetical protein
MADVFEARWLYNAEGQGAVVESEPEYDALTAAGWKHSPADFGVETHPSVTTQPVMVATVAPVAAPSEDLRALLTTIMRDYEEQLTALTARVTALEGAPPAPVATAETPPAEESEPHTRGRRS